MSFSENVKKLREKKGLTQAELAEQIGISQVMITQYERGLKVPTIIIGDLLAKSLGVSVEELLNGNEGTDKHE